MSVTCSANAVTLPWSLAQCQRGGSAAWVALDEERGASFVWLGHWPEIVTSCPSVSGSHSAKSGTCCPASGAGVPAVSGIILAAPSRGQCRGPEAGGGEAGPLSRVPACGLQEGFPRNGPLLLSSPGWVGFFPLMFSMCSGPASTSLGSWLPSAEQGASARPAWL